MELWIGIALAVVLFAVVAIILARRKPKRPEELTKSTISASPTVEPTTETAAEIEEFVEVPTPTVRVPEAPAGIDKGFAKTRTGLLQKLGGFFSATKLDAKEWEGLEEALLEGDVGMSTTQTLIERLKERIKGSSNGTDLKTLMVEEGQKLLGVVEHGPGRTGDQKPFVVSIVGVNGVGKTTTIGKLAQRYTSEGKKVLLGAGDTFRAAAISQLKVWADRTGADFVTGREGADPGAVAFDALTAAKARGIDIVFLDTAGRLHTKTNLMEELKKIHRVMKKVIPEAPHETWLVIDGTLGQNSVNQAKEFQKALDLTGVIVTKLDGTAKGGALIAIASELKLPIRFIGLGEGAGDLVPFEPKPFVEAILGV